MRAFASRPYAIALLLVGLLAACSTDTPTAPPTTGVPPPGGGGPSAAWNITVTVDPKEAVQNSDQPVTITVRVQQAGTNQAPPNGTTIVVSTNLGELLSLGSQIQSAVAALANGQTQLFYFPGNILGTAVIQAQLEASIGQATVKVIEAPIPVVAAFSFVNTDANRSVQFFNQSSGDPTKFEWEFGDGRTSKEENPVHVYAEGGDYIVTLTASKPGSTSTVSQAIFVPPDPEVGLFITDVTPNSGPPEGGTVVTITGTGFQTPLRVLFGSKLGAVTSATRTRITVSSPPGDMAFVACTKAGGLPGVRFVDTSVALIVELGIGPAATAPGGFTYLVSLSPDPTFGDCK